MPSCPTHVSNCFHILIVLQTDFSSLGFGVVLLQPGNDKASTKAAQGHQDRHGFSFMTKVQLQSSTQSASELAIPKEMKSDCIHILGRDSLGTTPSLNADNIYSANTSSGSQTAMPLS